MGSILFYLLFVYLLVLIWRYCRRQLNEFSLKFRKTIDMLSTFFILYLRYIPLLALVVYYVYLYMYISSMHFYRHLSATFLGGGGLFLGYTSRLYSLSLQIRWNDPSILHRNTSTMKFVVYISYTPFAIVYNTMRKSNEQCWRRLYGIRRQKNWWQFLG